MLTIRNGISVLFCIYLLLVSAVCSAFVPSDIPIDIRNDAVKATIEAAPECRNIPQFYWEIGDANVPLASGRKGNLFNANTRVSLASASKWIFATYLLEKYGALSSEQIQMLSQRSGYRTFLDQFCILSWNVNACMNEPMPMFAFNNLYTSKDIGTFFYSGAHFQKLGIDVGLGKHTAWTLTREIQKYLDDKEIGFAFPAIGSGMYSSASTFGKLMRKMMRDEFLMGKMLGSHRICTLPALCPMSLRSPLETDWDYSLGHWVEREPGGPDEAFSGPGLHGFYPWISADKALYGILSTDVLADVKALSSACGGKIRKAWISGVMVN